MIFRHMVELHVWLNVVMTTHASPTLNPHCDSLSQRLSGGDRLD